MEKREKMAYHKLILRKECVKYIQWNRINLGFMTVTVKWSSAINLVI